MKTLASILSSLCCFLLYSQDINIQLFSTGLVRPVNIAHAGDSRLFVVEQDGRIQIINTDGTLNTLPFLDIDNKVINLASGGDERGLLGLAFHPNYDVNGYFFVNYIDNNGNTVISRFTRDSVNLSIADPASELIILTFSQPFPNHNGGDLAFGPDGYLYIATGDGGSGGDPQNNAQNLTNFLGKILRIDIDGSNGPVNYQIPADNPFVSNPAALDEIWVYGLRNPWKFSFDRLTDDLWIGDVGQNDIEEVDLVPATTSGQNFGWRCYEGTAPFNTSGCPDISELTMPVAEYDHFADGLFKCSITGGFRYRGTSYPTLNGLYFFADYCSGEIGYLTENGPTWDKTFELFVGNQWTAFGEDVDGELYVAAINNGNIYRLIDANLSIDDNQLDEIAVYPNPTNNEIVLDLQTINPSLLEKILIFDLQGKMLKTYNPSDRIIQKINVGDLASGYYLMHIYTGSSAQSIRKFIIN